MKRRYYHFYPTCPNRGCHEPHRNEGVLDGDDETLCCVTCGTEFRRFLNLNSSIEDLFWGVEPNTLESAYIDWVCSRPSGQFVITWPWRDVRFLPVLAAEYALNNKKGKIAVVGRAMENGDAISFPALDTVFENIMYLNEGDVVKNTSMKKDLFKCINKCIIKKSKKIRVQIRIIGAGKKYERRCYESTILKCKNRIIKELDDEWGPDSIYRITIKKDGGNNKEEILNENATLDVTLTEMDKWSGKLEYLKDWELEVLSSSGDVHTPSSEMSYRAIRSPDDAEEDILGVRIMFISEDLQPDVLFPFLEKSGANTVIFQDADYFIKDILFYHGVKSKYLMDFLKNNRESDMAILMFSSQPEFRHIHSRFEDVANPLTTHTWDTEKRLEVLFRNGWSESLYSNPCFSLREFIPDHGQPPDMEYVSVGEIDDLFDKIDALLERITWQDNNLRKDVIRYFKDLRKTPLFLAGDFTKKEVFSRKGEYLDLTSNSVMDIIERVDEDVYDGMQDAWNVFSSNRPDKLSYLFDELLKLATNEIEKMDSSIITFVVHPYDVKGFKKLLLDGELGEYVQSGEVAAGSWSTELTARCRLARDSGKKHTVISTEQPSLNFNIYSCDIDKVIFSGSKKNLDKIRDIVEKRITERFTRPVAFLREDDDAPTLLREIEEAVHDSEIVDETDMHYSTIISAEEILLRSSYEISNAEKTVNSGESPQHTICIMAGDDAVVAIGRDGKIVLFPMDATLHFRKGGGTSRTEEIRISDDLKRLRGLKDVEISMSRDEIYRPLKVQFAEVMAETGRGLSIETGVFKWDTFFELLYDAVAWILYLLEAKEHLEKLDEHGIDADDELARKIVGSGTSARDPAYVRMWWKGQEGEASTDAGPIRIPSVEHPRNVDDMKKIYGVVNEIIPSINLSEVSAIRSYSAAMVIQKVRRSVLKGSPEDISPPLKKVYMRLRPIMDELWEQSDKFHVQYFDKIKLKKDTRAYRVIDSSDILIW